MSAEEFLAALAMPGADVSAWTRWTNDMAASTPPGIDYWRSVAMRNAAAGRTPETASEHAGEISAGYTLTRPPLPPAELVDHYARIFGNRYRAQATAEAVIRHARRQTTTAVAR